MTTRSETRLTRWSAAAVVLTAPPFNTLVSLAIAPALPGLARHIGAEADGELMSQVVMVAPAFIIALFGPLSGVMAERLGVRRANGQPFPRPGDHAFLLMPAGAQGPGFLMLPNFRAILRYNPAESYALAIGHLADRLRGGGPFVQSWPRSERVLSRAERLELQQLLARRGFYQGEADGQLGSATRKALRSYQASIGTPADGFASADMLERLRGH